MPTTRCGSTACWETRETQSAIGRQLGYWTETLKDLPEQIDLPSDRPRPAVSSYRGESVPLKLSAQLHEGLVGLSRASGASLFMVLQAGLSALLTGWGRAPISRSAARSRGAPTARSTTWSGSSSTRWCCAPTRRQLSLGAGGTGSCGQSLGLQPPDLPFERLVEVINPARSLSRHPLFQVMLALQNTAEVKLELDGLSCGFEGVATSSAKFDLSVSLGEERGADGAPAGIGGVVEYATDLFDRASVEALTDRLIRLLEAAVTTLTVRSGAWTSSPPTSAPSSCGIGTTRRVRPCPPPYPNCLPRRWPVRLMRSRWCARM